MKLNKEQKAAVEHGEGPLMIIAGAGTGKTTVIVERIKYLIEKKYAKPSEILALTFTEKAAGEMQERVDIALPLGYTDMWISTFHSFCDRLLRDEALEIGLPTNFKLLNEATMTQIVNQNIFEFDLDYFRPLGRPTSFVSAMLTHFSRLQDENVSAGEYVRWAKRKFSRRTKDKSTELEGKKYRELAGAYKKYEEIKTREGLLDFGDLIVKSIELLNRRPNVLSSYREKFKYILVDEFQDTNYAQNLLAMRLAGDGANITVVGDDDQSIFKFRGAAVSNILEFRKRYKRAKTVVLTKNYRSHQNILDSAYKLILYNNPDRLEVAEKINKRLIAKRAGEGEVSFFVAKTGFEEVDGIVAKIIELAEGEYSHGDMAVLVRANSYADGLVSAFGAKGIPAQFLGPERLFERQEIVQIISFLRVLTDTGDNLAMYKVLEMHCFDIGPREVTRLSSFAKRNNISLFEASERVGETGINKGNVKKIERVVKVINDGLKRTKGVQIGSVLYEFLAEAGLLSAIGEPKDELEMMRAKNVVSFFERVRRFEEEKKGNADVYQLLDWIDILSELGRSPAVMEENWKDEDTVKILTLHSAKGLEFPIVFMSNLTQDRFPSRKRGDRIPIPDELIREILPSGDGHMEEERRLFYVGMTRARDKVILSSAEHYPENKLKKKVSQFVVEALEEDVVKIDKKERSLVGVKKTKAKKKSTEKNKFAVDYLSYSMIESFQVCPLHYKLRYIAKMPSPPSGSLSLGVSVHGALKDFYSVKKSGGRLSQKLLLEALDNNWKRYGYDGKKHERMAYERAEGMLNNFYKAGHYKEDSPLALEQSFSVYLSDKGKGRLRIGGRIDQINDLGGGGIEIVDYKTGKAKDQKHADKHEQLTFYALAASMIGEYPFGQSPGEITLTLHFLETGERFSTTRTRKELNDYKGEIFEVREKIEKSDFLCSNHYFCQQGCEYSMFCGIK